MSVNQEDLADSLAEAFGMGPSSPEALDYARMVLAQGMMNPGIDTAPLEDLRAQQEDVKGALERARERMMQMRGPSRGEVLLAMSAGFGAPTRTGAFGETAGNVSRALQPIAARQSAFEQQQAEGLTELDIALAQVMQPVTQMESRLGQLQYQQQQQNMREALKTLARGSTGSRGSARREAKIQDLIELWGYTRRDAASLVDGFVNIEIVPETGRARLINEITKTVTEVPVGSLEGFWDLNSGMYIGAGPGNNLTTTPLDDTAKPVGQPVDNRTPAERDADLWVTQQFRDGMSIYQMAGIGTGPDSWARAGISIPSSLIGGPIATDTLIARQGLRLASKDLAENLVDNPKLPVAQMVWAMEAAGIEPSFWTTGPMMQDQIVALDSYLYRFWQDMDEIARDPNQPRDLQEDAGTNAELVSRFLRNLGVPPDVQRRNPYVPVDSEDLDDSLPALPESAPYGIEQRIWDNMSDPERQRVIILQQQLDLGGVE